MPVLLNYPLFHADDDNGAPLTGGLLYSYIVGSSTAKATYTTRAMSTANANPVVLNSRGEAIIYGSGLYKLILTTSAGVTIWTQDNVELGPGQGAYGFFADPSESDHGSAGTGASLYDILTALGTSKRATIFFPHSGVGNTTTYTVSTTFDASAYTNVIFSFENGAILAVATAKTLTLPSPGNIQAQPNQQIISGAGTVAFGTGGIVYPEWWGIDGTADQTQINAALNSLPSGNGLCQLLRKSYGISATITIPSNATLRGMGPKHSIIVPAASSFNAITFTASGSDMVIENLGVTGTDPVADNTERAIYGDTITDIVIQNCFFEKQNTTIQLATATRSKIINNEFFDTAEGATAAEGTAVLLTLTSTHCLVENNTFKAIHRHAIYLSSGTRYTVVRGNTIDTCREGAIQQYALAAQNACIHNVIEGNTIKDIDTATTIGHGITTTENCQYFIIKGNSVSGADTNGIHIEGNAGNISKPAYGVIEGNIINTTGDNGILLQNTDDCIVANNIIKSTTTYGINVAANGADVGSYCYRNQLHNNRIITAGSYAINIGTSRVIDTVIGYNLISGSVTGDIYQNGSLNPRLFTQCHVGSLTAGNANDFAFTWQNPHIMEILVTKIVVEVQTGGGTVGSLLNVGTAANATTGSDNLSDGVITLNTTDVYDNSKYVGTNGLVAQYLQANGGGTDWITGQITIANAASLVGKYYIFYNFRF